MARRITIATTITPARHQRLSEVAEDYETSPSDIVRRLITRSLREGRWAELMGDETLDMASTRGGRKPPGMKPRLTPADFLRMRATIKDGMPLEEACELFGITSRTYYRYLKRDDYTNA